LELFGSRARGEARAGSDVDVLVTFEPGSAPGLLAPDGFVGLIDALEACFQAPVDALTRASVEADHNEFFRREALAATEVLYAA
jgi:predicted nucleotidyltransferase